VDYLFLLKAVICLNEFSTGPKKVVGFTGGKQVLQDQARDDFFS
jgi:hypothetical protein